MAVFRLGACSLLALSWGVSSIPQAAPNSLAAKLRSSVQTSLEAELARNVAIEQKAVEDHRAAANVVERDFEVVTQKELTLRKKEERRALKAAQEIGSLMSREELSPPLGKQRRATGAKRSAVEKEEVAGTPVPFKPPATVPSQITPLAMQTKVPAAPPAAEVKVSLPKPAHIERDLTVAAPMLAVAKPSVAETSGMLAPVPMAAKTAVKPNSAAAEARSAPVNTAKTRSQPHAHNAHTKVSSTGSKVWPEVVQDLLKLDSINKAHQALNFTFYDDNALPTALMVHESTGPLDIAPVHTRDAGWFRGTCLEPVVAMVGSKNAIAFAIGIGLLVTMILGLTVCWGDVERLSMRPPHPKCAY